MARWMTFADSDEANHAVAQIQINIGMPVRNVDYLGVSIPDLLPDGSPDNDGHVWARTWAIPSYTADLKWAFPIPATPAIPFTSQIPPNGNWSTTAISEEAVLTSVVGTYTISDTVPALWQPEM